MVFSLRVCGPLMPPLIILFRLSTARDVAAFYSASAENVHQIVVEKSPYIPAFSTPSPPASDISQSLKIVHDIFELLQTLGLSCKNPL